MYPVVEILLNIFLLEGVCVLIFRILQVFHYLRYLFGLFILRCAVQRYKTT